MAETVDVTETQQMFLWAFFGTVCFITSIVLTLAIRNLVYMCKLGIKRTLIIILYIALIAREVFGVALVFIFCKYHLI